MNCQEAQGRKPRLYLYNSSFDPPGNHNIRIAEALISNREKNDLVWIMPYGGRPDTKGIASAKDRHEMIICAFSQFPEAIIDLADLGKHQFTYSVDLEKRFKKNMPGFEIWHVIGSDMIENGNTHSSKIHTKWHEGGWAFDHLNFLILNRENFPTLQANLPVHAECLFVHTSGTNAEIRERVRTGQSIDDFVPKSVAAYIKEHKLYLV